MKTSVELSDKAKKQLKKLPKHIVFKFYAWVEFLAEIGITEVRKTKGFHDEPLKGDRKGQRSVRLNKSYRAIYIEVNNNIELVEVLEINNHEY
jgi:proteic killer suppression protein